MKRFATTAAVVFGFLAFAPGAFAQAAKATPASTQAAPPPTVAQARMASPVKPDLYKSTLMVNHANGKVTAKGVKKFTDDKK